MPSFMRGVLPKYPVVWGEVKDSFLTSKLTHEYISMVLLYVNMINIWQYRKYSILVQA